MAAAGDVIFKYDIGRQAQCDPAIGVDGTVYISGSNFDVVIDEEEHKIIDYIDLGDYTFALNPDGTLKWEYAISKNHYSPSFGKDGTIYSSGINQPLIALNPDGTLKWEFHYPAIWMVKFYSKFLNPNRELTISKFRLRNLITKRRMKIREVIREGLKHALGILSNIYGKKRQAKKRRHSFI